ncbi:MAG: SWIM zinc finger domain-containing protein [bacterium]|nr:SWIM zinc finger domain-containing protein [bacterium]
MAKVKQRRTAKDRPESHGEAWGKITWNDLDEWAGARTVSRGRSYQRNGRVKQLCVFESGMLLAWVHGGDRYATRVDLDTTKRKRSERMTSECSCPVRFACKHAVAVIVEYLEAIQAGTPVSGASDDDPRLALIEGRVDEIDDDGWEDEPRSKAPRPRKRTKTISDRDIRTHLASKSADELVEMVMRACDRDPEVRTALVDESALAGGRFDDLLSEARSEMHSLTAEEAWQNAWTGAGHLPDYSRLEKRLKPLLDHGRADAIVQLGEDLLRRGTDQIEQSHDEGETARAIGDCMQIVYEALLQSSRRDEDKIIYAIDMVLADEYGICDALAAVSERRWKKATWSVVADRLRERLGGQGPATEDRDEWLRSYRRERLSEWVITALDKAGRRDEATELCVAEARASNSYPRAVRRLIEAGQDDRATELARQGLDATSPRYAGVVRDLQDLLCEIAVNKGDSMLPASVAADRFFRWPSVDSYRELLQAAEKTDHIQTVQKAAQAFLECGRRPDRPRDGGRSKQGTSRWPLPEPPQPDAQQNEGRSERVGPHFDVLIDLAIDEKRPDDVLVWFDRRDANNPSTARRRQSHAFRDYARVAKAVEGAHPDRAIEIYVRLANAVAAETNPKTYPEAGAYLKRVKSLLKKSGRAQDWPRIIGDFRTENRRKRRLMEVLDGIEGRPIVKRTHR